MALCVSLRSLWTCFDLLFGLMGLIWSSAAAAAASTMEPLLSLLPVTDSGDACRLAFALILDEFLVWCWLTVAELGDDAPSLLTSSEAPLESVVEELPPEDSWTTPFGLMDMSASLCVFMGEIPPAGSLCRFGDCKYMVFVRKRSVNGSKKGLEERKVLLRPGSLLDGVKCPLACV